jgi:hypothetical protein
MDCSDAGRMPPNRRARNPPWRLDGLLGHKDVSTRQIYTHALNRRGRAWSAQNATRLSQQLTTRQAIGSRWLHD